MVGQFILGYKILIPFIASCLVPGELKVSNKILNVKIQIDLICPYPTYTRVRERKLCSLVKYSHIVLQV